MADLTLAPTRTVSLTLTGNGGTLTLTTATDAMVITLAPILRGPRGPQGIPGEAYINIDGGTPTSIYGGVTPIDAGGP